MLRFSIINMVKKKREYDNGEIRKAIKEFGKLKGIVEDEELSDLGEELRGIMLAEYSTLLESRGFARFPGKVVGAALMFEGSLETEVENSRELFSMLLKNYSSNEMCSEEWFKDMHIYAIKAIVDMAQTIELSADLKSQEIVETVAEVFMDDEFHPSMLEDIVEELEVMIENKSREMRWEEVIAALALEVCKADITPEDIFLKVSQPPQKERSKRG